MYENFPTEFVSSLQGHLKNVDELLEALESEPSTSIRVNPLKCPANKDERDLLLEHLPIKESIEWTNYGYSLNHRPSFTHDPLFQAGVYYVQEASSMYLEKISTYLPENKDIKALDLCASPGGKSSHLLSILGEKALLIANEVIKSRAWTLAENLTKWGAPNIVVSNNDPADFTAFKEYFDLVVVDAPCSGEGMFRKNIKARQEWSKDNVKLCALRQRRILSDIWGALKDGGLLVYSTCTFNTTENDENANWIAEELGATLLESKQFYPSKDGIGEGYYMAILRKGSDSDSQTNNQGANQRNNKKTYNTDKLIKSLKLTKVSKSIFPNKQAFTKDGFEYIIKGGDLLKAYPSDLMEEMLYCESQLRVIHSALACAEIKGTHPKSTLVPHADLALNSALNRDAFNSVELFSNQDELPAEKALSFLRKEPLVFSDQPKGYLLLTYKGKALGFVKNLGNRSNNLWPNSWRILT